METAALSRKGVIAIALLVSLSFALGYVWGHGASVAPIVIEKCLDK